MSAIEERAELLEGLLPKLMRSLYRTGEDDPLHDLPLAQLRIIRSLRTGQKTPSELAQEFGTSISSITQISSRLEEAGLVSRTASDDYRRVKHLTLSRRGQKMMADRHRRRIERVVRALETLTEDEQVAAISALQQLIAAGHAVSPPPPDSIELIAAIEESP